MGRRKTKFEVLLGEVSFKNIAIKFETDQSDEPEVLENVRGVLGNIIGTPNRLLMLEANGMNPGPVNRAVPPDVPAIPSSAPKPRRRRRFTNNEATSAHLPQPTNGNGEIGIPGGGTRPNSVKGLILQLHRDGYFQEERTSSEVSQELSNRWGRKVKTNHIATALQQLTGNALSRRKTDDRKMRYRSVDHAL